MPYSRYCIGTIPWYSVLIVCGVLCAIFTAWREQKRLALPQDMTVDLALLLLPLGIIGARLYYVIFRWEQYARDLPSILRVWEGGLAIYGGVIGGILGVYIYHRIKKLPLGTLLDCVAPGVVLAQSIGRWGNFFNQEAYGRQVANAAMQFFPAAVYIEAESGWFMATFFYESVWDLAVFITLWLTRKKRRHAGDTVLGYLLLYGGGRLLTEGLRMDSLTATGGVRVSQLLSCVLCLAVFTIIALRAWPKESRGLRITTATLACVLLTCAVPVLTGTLPWAGPVFTLAAIGGTLLNERHT